MSVVSSRLSSSISSILKNSGKRSSLVGTPKRISFQLPKNIKELLTKNEKGGHRQDYLDTICILRDTNLKVNFIN